VLSVELEYEIDMSDYDWGASTCKSMESVSRV
jgi:hypothetical protein